MNDGERLQAFIEQLQSQSGLDAVTYERLLAELNTSQTPAGQDAEGRQRIAFFDAKQYDLNSFSHQNEGRFELIPMETPTKELGSLTRPNPLMEAPTLIPNNFTDATTSTGEIGKKTHGRLNAGRKPRSGIGTAKPP